MKSSRMRSILLLFLTLSFLGGIVFFVIELAMNAGSWALKPFNKHLVLDSLANAGKIYDRNSVILAQSVDGKRIYNKDANIRKAMLHIVGDEAFNISTSIQSKMRDKLFGYNYLTGIDTPWFLKTSNDVTLTLDSKLCKSAFLKFEDKKGAAIFLNYKTGEIICMISSPTYDINNPPDIEKSKEYDGVYLNKAISASFTPGSVFKVITTICAAENIEDLDSLEFNCNHSKILDGEKIICMENHGNINLKNGIKNSCNIFFGDLALSLGKEKMKNTANSLEFNKPLTIDFTETIPSHYDVSDASKGSFAWSGIGQYNNMLNPAHMASIFGSIANNGIAVSPKIIKNDIKNFFSKNNSNKQYMSSKSASKLKELLSFNIKNGNISHLFKGLDICGKTGTAEVGDNKKPHAWMAGFLNDDKYPISFAIVVENSGFGGENAAPIAASLLKEFEN